eukprot:gnl/TRDRNA2_/TRDRNA2_186660_c0_seq1.p1 gnl/TRDRNA2_/TRDRNA2_186660_c0~~gnl/TRDRNA2_/TRDRNA2_186660_c0_seq1.p1  ORF type:complete len:285 (+),score=54.14 gnl/TRDRNA2_/TRDRNA2_186660_c0_seq1:131-985(+)
MSHQQCQQLGREIINRSRLGGSTIAEIKEKEKAARAEKAEKAQGGKGEKTMSKSQSAPSLSVTKNSTRMGGGWARPNVVVDLTKFKEALEQMHEWKGDIDFREKPYFRTALWQATWKNNEDIVRRLVANGASVSTPDYQGRTPLHEAAFYGHLNLVEFFLDRGHPIDCVDEFGETPLLRAVNSGRHEVVRLLVERGAKMNQVDADGCSAQHLAAFKGRPLMSDYLMYKGTYANRFSISKPETGSTRERIGMPPPGGLPPRPFKSKLRMSGSMVFGQGAKKLPLF